MDDQALVAAFLADARARGRVAASTLEAYGLDLLVVARWAAGRGRTLAGLDGPALREFFAERLAGGCSPATVARQLTSCRKFYTFLAASRGGPVPTAGLRNPARNPARAPLLPAAALTAVARAVGGGSGDLLATYRAHRDHAMACLLMSSGMQVSAIRTLRWTDIDADWRRVRGHVGTPSEHSYTLRDEAREALIELRRLARAADQLSEYCFPSSRGRPLSRQGLCQRIRKLGRDIGLAPVVTPTALRRAAPRHFRPRPAPVAAAVVS